MVSLGNQTLSTLLAEELRVRARDIAFERAVALAGARLNNVQRAAQCCVLRANRATCYVRRAACRGAVPARQTSHVRTWHVQERRTSARQHVSRPHVARRT